MMGGDGLGEFPTRAGMNRLPVADAGVVVGVLDARGDEPLCLSCIAAYRMSSPPAWGFILFPMYKSISNRGMTGLHMQKTRSAVPPVFIIFRDLGGGRHYI